MYTLSVEQKLSNYKELVKDKEEKVKNLNTEIDNLKKKISKLESKVTVPDGFQKAVDSLIV